MSPCAQDFPKHKGAASKCTSKKSTAHIPWLYIMHIMVTLHVGIDNVWAGRPIQAE